MPKLDRCRALLHQRYTRGRPSRATRAAAGSTATQAPPDVRRPQTEQDPHATRLQRSGHGSRPPSYSHWFLYRDPHIPCHAIYHASDQRTKRDMRIGRVSDVTCPRASVWSVVSSDRRTASLHFILTTTAIAMHHEHVIHHSTSHCFHHPRAAERDNVLRALQASLDVERTGEAVPRRHRSGLSAPECCHAR